jgi:hypothetical protein
LIPYDYPRQIFPLHHEEDDEHEECGADQVTDAVLGRHTYIHMYDAKVIKSIDFIVYPWGPEAGS